MKVFVVMGNDFPDAVFSNEALAEAYMTTKKNEDPRKGYGNRIHWRCYEFDVNETVYMHHLPKIMS